MPVSEPTSTAGGSALTLPAKALRHRVAAIANGSIDGAEPLGFDLWSFAFVAGFYGFNQRADIAAGFFASPEELSRLRFLGIHDALLLKVQSLGENRK
jgi:hypothetical protein